MPSYDYRVFVEVPLTGRTEHPCPDGGAWSHDKAVTWARLGRHVPGARIVIERRRVRKSHAEWLPHRAYVVGSNGVTRAEKRKGGAQQQNAPKPWPPMTAASWIALNDEAERLRAEVEGLLARLRAQDNPPPPERTARARRLLSEEPEAVPGREWLDVALDVIERMRATR